MTEKPQLELLGTRLQQKKKSQIKSPLFTLRGFLYCYFGWATVQLLLFQNLAHTFRMLVIGIPVAGIIEIALNYWRELLERK